ncbi:hypothetical protein TNCT_629281 [Trichonephila clavata]|uniref:Uncharacterized protein n=1 Tax=Trichonephila clavata TaxID=2740835 RepID=A0A8X6L7X2_TRICU|nr:hypothetical protein TNCT_629281 [Trichonephila clavata]
MRKIESPFSVLSFFNVVSPFYYSLLPVPFQGLFRIHNTQSFPLALPASQNAASNMQIFHQLANCLIHMHASLLLTYAIGNKCMQAPGLLHLANCSNGFLMRLSAKIFERSKKLRMKNVGAIYRVRLFLARFKRV